jgi:hypothetical protein
MHPRHDRPPYPSQTPSFYDLLAITDMYPFFGPMVGAHLMLKYAQQDVAPNADVPVAKPRRKPIDIDGGYKRAMERHPKMIARLAE